MTFLAPAFPALAALLYALLGWNRVTAWLGAAASAGVLACGIAPPAGSWGLLRADALSAFMLIVIGAVALMAMLASPSYLDAELKAERTGPRALRRYGILTQALVAAMAVAVLAASLGVLWVAVEATTVLAAFLVGFRRTRRATEAAWKYVVICSVGIALALLGIVMIHFAAAHAGVISLDLDVLTAHAAFLDPGVTRMAIALLVLGFGTKAGLAPMHGWLPDAYSQAPAPVAALMSGVLSAVAFYAILRVKVISDAALGAPFARTILVVAALASLAVAALLLLAQRDYKRMLAYSSIEHMGLLSLGAAIGGRLALGAVLLHVLGHGLGKSALFLSSGQLQQAFGGSATDRVRGLAVRAPFLGAAFALGLFAILGLPPFSLFASEVGIVRAGFGAGLGWAVAVALALMLVVVAAMGRRARDMLLGPSPGGAAVPARDVVPLVLGLGACAVLGLFLGPLQVLLNAAVAGLAP
ncbi:proton-conducting transporter membrane subunit [Nonomuraea sp. NPDC050556]|uniref:proton-conducting transporter transmembrane domain-containing protein n=1 Tax=Nonomuraea sp. NPDC050556 TaxID=3364369 RepID=UPI00378A9C82